MFSRVFFIYAIYRISEQPTNEEASEIIEREKKSFPSFETANENVNKIE